MNKNKNRNQEPANPKSNIEGFGVISLDTINRGGFQFKVSANNYDGSVFLIAKSDLFNYFTIKCFPDSKSARQWVDNLVSTTRIMCSDILKDE